MKTPSSTLVRLACSICCILSAMLSSNKTKIQYNTILLLPVVLFLDEMIPSAECNEMRIVGRRRDGDAAGAAHVRVAQLIGQHLEIIRIEVVVVPQNVVMRRTTRSLHHHPTTQKIYSPTLRKFTQADTQVCIFVSRQVLVCTCM